MNKRPYSTEVGSYLVIQITGDMRIFLAEVTQFDPLEMKVEESGSYAHLKEGDFIVLEEETMQVQKDDREDTCVFLTAMQERGCEIVSGLKSLGVKDNKLRKMLPETRSLQQQISEFASRYWVHCLIILTFLMLIFSWHVYAIIPVALTLFSPKVRIGLYRSLTYR